MTDSSVSPFPFIPASKESTYRRRPVCGVGVNDAPYVTTPRVRGALLRCPYYIVWANMITRGYSAALKRKSPTYARCSVAPEWHSFMAFRAWMAAQDWYGKELDKDILVPGNKVYGPDTCVFVDSATNSLMTDCAAARGKWPIGVSQKGRRYLAGCRGPSGGIRIGVHDTPEEANLAWRAVKAYLLTGAAARQSDPRVRKALTDRAATLLATGRY